MPIPKEFRVSVCVLALSAAAAPAWADPGDLLPDGEAERMDGHDADLGRIHFKPGKGLTVSSEDGAFKLETRVRGQIRETILDASGDDLQQQLRLRRVRVVFSGHLFGKQNAFKMELAVSPNDAGVGDNLDDPGPTLTPLLDLYFEFRQLRDLTLRVGQYKLPSNRTRVISSGNLQLVDRSIVNGEFTLDRDIGLDFRSKDLFGLGVLKYYAGVSVGRGRDSQGFDDFGMNYFIRAEYLPFGKFKDYSEVDFARSAAPRLSVGVIYAYQDRNRGLRRITSRIPADGGTTDMHLFMADAIFKLAGFSAQWELAWRDGTRNPGDAVDDMGTLIPPTDPRNGWGTMFQAGYLIPRLPLEFAARFGLVRATGDMTSLTDSNELGGGASWYFARHPFKLQLDAFRLWGDDFGDGDTRIRLQLQASL